MNKLMGTNKIILSGLLLTTMLGCSSMQTTNSGFLSEQHKPLSTGSEKIMISWKMENDQTISAQDKHQISTSLSTALLKELAKINPNNGLSDIRIRAAITRVETVSVPLNWLTTILLFAPLDRGGIAAEFEAIDIKNNSSIVQMNFASWTPISAFSARYNRLEPAKIATKQAAKRFIEELHKNLPAS
ncbi:hypothetical protein ACWXWU_04465 [Shewanella sp. A14]